MVGDAATPAARRGLVSGYRLRTLAEWGLLLAMLAAFMVGASVLGWTGRASLAVYDVAIAAQQHAPRQDIVIVAIDDGTLEASGRWPWRRTQLSRLIDGVAAGNPAVIALDVVLTEPDERHPGDDAALARSIARAGKVVLPAVAAEAPDGLRYPIPALRADVGHINIGVDGDGPVRDVFLREGPPGRELDHLVVRMLALRDGPDVISQLRQERYPAAPAAAWRRDGRVRIAFAGPAGTFATVSARDVMAGRVDPAMFRNRLVLIGVTAAGLGGMFAVPLSRDGAGMSGVEIMANAAQTLLDGQAIVALDRTASWALAFAALGVVWVAALRLSPRLALLASLAMVAGLLGASIMLVRGAHAWFDPVPAMLACLACYPLWSWRRQEATLAFLAGEVARLEREQEPMLRGQPSPVAGLGPSLDARMQAMYWMTTRLRDMRQFLADAMSGLPDATLICNIDGNVLLANARSLALMPRSLGALAQAGAPAPEIRVVMTEAFAVPQRGMDYWNTVRRACVETMPAAGAPPVFDAVELTTHTDCPMLVRAASLRSSDGGVAGIALSFVDITEARAAERRREETLRFISHDMRSPQASILALVELQSEPARAMPYDALLERIQHFASRTLELADDFITLARAESQALRLVETDLSSLVMDATDELWPVAHARRIGISLDIAEEELVVRAEPSLLMRAVANLVDNAIKFSPDGGTVTVTVRRTGNSGTVSIADRGPGIALADQPRLFQPFSTLRAEGARPTRGTGLGLLFVRTVVERHAGGIGLDSAPGRGSVFSMTLPLAEAPESAAAL